MYIRHPFPVNIRCLDKRNSCLCTPMGCAAHHLANRNRTSGVVEYRASENVTLGFFALRVALYCQSTDFADVNGQ